MHNLKLARAKGIETVLNPAPARPLPNEAYQATNHLIVNETEAISLSGIKPPIMWDQVAKVFIARGVENVIITLGGDVSLYLATYIHPANSIDRVSTTKPQSGTPNHNAARSYQHGKSKSSTPPLQAILSSAHTRSLLHDGRRAERLPISIWMLLLCMRIEQPR